MPPERDPDDASALARLNSRLYAPGAGASQVNESLRPAAPASAPVAWTPPQAPPPKKRLPASVLFLIAAAGFFVIAGGVAAYLLFFGARVVSSDRVEITVDTAPSISSGDAASVLISVVNRNPVPIRATSLTIDFPDSAREPENLAKEMSHYADTLGTIEPGARVERTVRVALFGTEGESITLPVRLEYQTDGSQTPFVKEESHALTITSSPLSVSVKAPVESGVGQPLTVSVTVRSNARVALDRVALLPSYPPSGFTPAAGTPGAGTLIPIGTLAPGEERTVEVRGSIFGEVTDEHVFRFAAGTRASDDASALAVTYASSLASVALTKPFIATGLTLNQSATDPLTAPPGAPISATVTWKNTLDVALEDAQVSVKLSGDGFDPDSVRPGSGYYRSSDQTVLFSRDTLPALATLAPGAEGSGSFAFSPKAGGALAGAKSPSMTLSVSVAGRRVGETGVPESLASTVVRTVKVGTQIGFTAKALRTAGGFSNTGPWPPVAGAESTYAIQWSLANTANAVAGAKVTATLPSNVRFTGVSTPADGSVSYNATTRTVSWVPGDVAAGVSLTAAFQVALLPSASERGTSPVLIANQAFSGTDRFTKQAVAGTAADLTTEVRSDPNYQPNLGKVAN